MFVCDGRLQHGQIGLPEEKRTEKNLIVRSGISEAETTNNKDCARRFVLKLYRHEASRVASLRQQSFLF